MYRQYEDPYKIAELVREQERYCEENPDDIDGAIELESLRQRENFAWQDDEYDEDYERGYDY